MSRNLLSSFLEYRNNPCINLRTKGPSAFGYRPPSFLCGQTQTCLFHVWLHSLEYIRRVHEHLNPVRLTVRRLLYLTKTESKFNRAQHGVDYEPGVMSGLSRSHLYSVGLVRWARSNEKSYSVTEAGSLCQGLAWLGAESVLTSLAMSREALAATMGMASLLRS